jgi:hypothetical protein
MSLWVSLFGVPSDPLSGALSDPLSGAPSEPPTGTVGRANGWQREPTDGPKGG